MLKKIGSVGKQNIFIFFQKILTGLCCRHIPTLIVVVIVKNEKKDLYRVGKTNNGRVSGNIGTLSSSGLSNQGFNFIDM